jgi:bifunctional oligoribonuclease and PAP phosphatase NrnA
MTSVTDMTAVTTMTKKDPELQQIINEVRSRQRFVLASHSRPDGDSIGSQLAMAFALRALGKEVRVINKDAPPGPIMAFPGVQDIEVADEVSGTFDAAIIMECGDLARTGLLGLERYFVINIDHHPGNSGYGQIKWFDPTAAACGEMVYTLVRALGVPLSIEIATHVYLAILTDAAGVDPVIVARNVYDSNNMGRLKLFGAVLSGMQIDDSGRMAIVYLDHEMARAAGGTYEDTEGLINIPLTVKEIQTVVFFKQIEGEQYRVSLRSKGNIDVGTLAKEYGGGGHKNAAGCTVSGPIDALQRQMVQKLARAIDEQKPEVAHLENSPP